LNLPPAQDASRPRWLREFIKSAPACNQEGAKPWALLSEFGQSKPFHLKIYQLWTLPSRVLLAVTSELGLKPSVLKKALRRRLFMIAAEGVTDPTILRDRALKSMNVDKIAT